jgi:hypothetical protein
MVFTVMMALAQMELEIKRERVRDSVSNVALPAGISVAAARRSHTARSATRNGSSSRANRPARSRATSECPAPPSTDELLRSLPSLPRPAHRTPRSQRGFAED